MGRGRLALEVRLPDDLLVAGGLAFTPDGRQLITVNTEGVVKVWDVPTGGGRASRSAPKPGCSVTGWRSVRDRRLLAIGCEDGTIKVVATEPLKEVRTLEAHTGEISGMAFGAGDEAIGQRRG